MAELSLRQLSLVCRRVGLALRAGVDLVKIWNGEADRAAAKYRDSFRLINDRLLAGDTLSEAMTATRGSFPRFVCEMVDIGEKTGRVDEVFLRLADHYDHIREMQRTFLQGIAWPAFQLIAAICVIGLLIWIMGILPPGIDGQPIDILGFGLVGTSGVIKYFFVVFMFFASIWFVFYAFWRGWLGTGPVRVAMRIPVLGALYEALALERLCWSLWMALEAGIDAKRSIRIALRSTQNPLYLDKISFVERMTQSGNEFHVSLRETGVFPAEFLDSLEAAEIAGTHVHSLSHLGKQYEEKVKLLSKAVTFGATVVVWLSVVCFLVFMIFRVFSFYAGILNEATKI